MKDENLGWCYSPFNWFQDYIGERPSGWTKKDFNECMDEFINEFYSRPDKLQELDEGEVYNCLASLWIAHIGNINSEMVCKAITAKFGTKKVRMPRKYKCNKHDYNDKNGCGFCTYGIGYNEALDDFIKLNQHLEDENGKDR